MFKVVSLFSYQVAFWPPEIISDSISLSLSLLFVNNIFRVSAGIFPTSFPLFFPHPVLPVAALRGTIYWLGGTGKFVL